MKPTAKQQTKTDGTLVKCSKKGTLFKIKCLLRILLKIYFLPRDFFVNTENIPEPCSGETQ